MTATRGELRGSSPRRCQPDRESQRSQHRLDPARLPNHIDLLYRAARTLCGSPHEVEDLVQDTFANVLARPWLLRNENEMGYLLRALRNTHANRQRAGAHRPATVPLHESDPCCRADQAGAFDAREVLTTIAAAPKHYRDAVVAVDIEGLSYRQAARQLRAPVATIATRVSRRRRHVARALSQSWPR